MTDVTVSAEAVEEVKPAGLKPVALDDQLISQLVDRAKADRIKLTVGGGLLQQLTKKVLESVLEGEISAHLAEVYGAEVSRTTISTITDRVIDA